MLPGLYSATLKSVFIAGDNHHPCSMASTLRTYTSILPTYSHPSLPAATTIRAPWPLLCQLMVSLHCLPQPPSARPGLYSDNLWSAFIALYNHHPCCLASTLPTYAFIACHSHQPCFLASTLPTYSQPSLPATTTFRAPWPLLCHFISHHPCSLASTLSTYAFIACHNHHPCSLASTLPSYGQPSMLARTTIRALWPLLCQLFIQLIAFQNSIRVPWPLLCELIVSLHFLQQPPSMLSDLLSANLWSAFIACHNHHPCSLVSTLPTYTQPSLLATTTIHALWSLLCQLIVSLHCLPEPPSKLPGSTLPTYGQPSLLAKTTIHTPWPPLCKIIVSLHCLPQPPSMLPGLYFANLQSAFIACDNHHPFILPSTLPIYGKASLLATTIIRAPWPLLCELIVSLHCFPQPPSVLPGLYSANL
ncbi:hypothetical protein PoB_003913000 [Plakobranchus ocellatus]|uniref:Uncharacterized protein n=1 Tax=Plakobranchus ocellatus TaxID=259542 RepID=A0AAV4AW67_9GAST|nr:hypothetical protein PoB_003913000 [Plakobranchus ocellatus]